jgi:hypothetical protein
MLVLVLVACLEGHDCRVVQLAEEMPIRQCMVYAQPLAAKWVEVHPGITVKKLRCVRPKDVASTTSDREEG